MPAASNYVTDPSPGTIVTERRTSIHHPTTVVPTAGVPYSKPARSASETRLGYTAPTGGNIVKAPSQQYRGTSDAGKSGYPHLHAKPDPYAAPAHGEPHKERGKLRSELLSKLGSSSNHSHSFYEGRPRSRGHSSHHHDHDSYSDQTHHPFA